MILLNRSISSGITDVSRVSNDSMRVVLYCMTRVWEDGMCVAVAEMWEDDVYVVLSGVTGLWEDGMCMGVVLCGVTEVWED